MSTLTIASDPQDAKAVEAVEAHHAQLAGELGGRVTMLIDAVERGSGTADEIRAGLVAFCEDELVPHALAEENALYPAAQGTIQAKLLVDGMLAEHRRITSLVEALRTASSPVRAASDARALQVLFEEHLTKENELILPLIAASPELSLAKLLDGMHELLGGHAHGHAEAEGAQKSGGCGGTCGCGGSDDADVPELDARAVPHALRHATIFGARDAVAPGRSMVLVAPHDPLPLLAQIEARDPGAFTFEYLERGPEAWRLLFTRH
jgi:uncharacterized protein (DUF2249 family)/iron-sulfur cluster repair protein YtfE (RIC family)